MRVLFSGQRKTGHVDLEAVEMMVRSGMHRAGATGLEAMLAVPAPSASERAVRVRRTGALSRASKPVLTAAGRLKVSRPYYWCGRCRRSQFPADAGLDIPF